MNKCLISIFVILVIEIPVLAQERKLSSAEQEKLRSDISLAVLINSRGAQVYETGISSEYVTILSYSFSESGKIARVKGHYASAPKDSWIEIFFHEDLAYGIVYSQNPKNIITPYVVAPSGAMQPYQGSKLNEVLMLQKELAKTLQREREQQQLVTLQKNKDENSGEQKYDSKENDVSSEVFTFVKKCLDEFYYYHNDDKMISNTLTVKVRKTSGNLQTIRASFMIKPLFFEENIPEWLEIQFENGFAFVMYFSTGKLHELEEGEVVRHMTKRYYTPLASIKRNETSVYNETDLARIRALQEKFFQREKAEDAELYKSRYMKVIKQQQAMNNNVISTGCFALEKKQVLRVASYTQNKLTKYDENGQPYDISVAGEKPNYKTVTITVLRNKCKTSVVVYGMQKYSDNGEGDDIKYKDATFTLEPGAYIEYVPISSGGYDDAKTKIDDTFYYLKPESNIKTGK